MFLGKIRRTAYAVDNYAQRTKSEATPVTELKSEPVTTVVERIVEKPVYVDRIVEVEKVVEVEKIVEVEKPVYVDRIVEVEKVVEKTVPADNSSTESAFFGDFSIPSEWSAKAEAKN